MWSKHMFLVVRMKVRTCMETVNNCVNVYIYLRKNTRIAMDKEY